MKKVYIDKKCIACGLCFECKYVVENPDGTAIIFDRDYDGRMRGEKTTAGPWEV